MVKPSGPVMAPLVHCRIMGAPLANFQFGVWASLMTHVVAFQRAPLQGLVLGGARDLHPSSNIPIALDLLMKLSCHLPDHLSFPSIE